MGDIAPSIHARGQRARRACASRHARNHRLSAWTGEPLTAPVRRGPTGARPHCRASFLRPISLSFAATPSAGAATKGVADAEKASPCARPLHASTFAGKLATMATRPPQRRAKDFKPGRVTGWPPNTSAETIRSLANAVTYGADGKHKDYPAFPLDYEEQLSARS